MNGKEHDPEWHAALADARINATAAKRAMSEKTAAYVTASEELRAARKAWEDARDAYWAVLHDGFDTNTHETDDERKAAREAERDHAARMHAQQMVNR